MIRSAVKLWLPLIISVIWVFLATAALLLFNQYLLMSLPLGLRIMLCFVTYWCVAAVPLIFALRDGYCPFPAEKLWLQLLWGLVLGAGVSVVFTLLPRFLGLGHLVGSGNGYRKLWQFVYELLYQVAAVALVEEFLFRGFLYHLLRLLLRREWAAVLVSSVLFGLLHFGSGDPVHMVSTAVLGALLCLCRNKLRHCTLLSLVLAHGLYNWLISLWSFIFG